MARTDRTVDIHDYEKRYNQTIAHVTGSAISERNKQLIFAYRDTCLLKGVCSKVRLIRIMGALALFARHLGKDFDRATKQDLEMLITALLARTPPYSAETLGTYRAILRSFMTWVIQPDLFPTKHPPAMVAWLNSHVKAKDKRKLDRNELLTEEEIKQLLAVAHHPRDKAFIMMLWETGARISELGNLQLQHISKHQFGYTLDLRGKTGQRCPLIISSAPYLTAWLNMHPFGTDPKNPLWVYNQHTTTPRHVRYQALRTLLRRLLQRAGIHKRIHPHLFRHSRPTYCLAKGIFTDAQARRYFGWSQTSRMLGTYAHLVDEDLHTAVLRENNLSTQAENATSSFIPRLCTTCKTTNPPGAMYCLNCNTVFNERAVQQNAQSPNATNQLILELVKVLVEKGLVDEAARTVHEAGLGPTLEHLTTSSTQRPPGMPGPPPQ